MHNLLTYRFLLLNMLLLSAVAMGFATGKLQQLFLIDETRITWGIALLFAVVLIGTTKEVFVASRMLNEGMGGPAASREEADKDMAKIKWLHKASDWLAGLGLLGTLVGFAMAIAHLATSTGGISGAKDVINEMMAGMGIAVSSSILGTALAMWNDVNVMMLTTALTCYWSDRQKVAV